MELRLLMMIARLLDPRAWRRRLLQLAGVFAGFVWIWIRAVRAIDGVRMRRDLHHAERDALITTRQRADERRRIDESLDSLA
jgi:hypothetical protein